MSILIDPPLWPAHGRMWSHLVSDRSLQELHRFAEDAGLDARAFDLDHYDVPSHLREQMIAQGAVDVTANTLTRRLIASGLRVKARDR